MDLQTVIIVALICFILGMSLGVSLVRPRSAYRRPLQWEE